MEYIKEININEAVIHILDHNLDEPILNEFRLDLTEDIYMFLYKHIQKILKDEELKYARFKEGKNIVKGVTREYLSGHNNILEISKELAKQMFSLMKSKGSISSCDLIVVSISTEYGPMIGILKIDYVKNYMHTVETVDKKIDINIMPQTTGLPARSSKIGKSAFIRCTPNDEGVELMILDKQKRLGEKHTGTDYFIDNYLGCEVMINERDMTKGFLMATEKWNRENLGDNTEQAQRLRRKIKKKLIEEKNIDLEKLSEEIFNEHESREKFKDYIKSYGIEKDIAIDREWMDKKLKKIRLKIDGDIDLYMTSKTYMDDTRFNIEKNNDGSLNMIIKNISSCIEK